MVIVPGLVEEFYCTKVFVIKIQNSHSVQQCILQQSRPVQVQILYHPENKNQEMSILCYNRHNGILMLSPFSSVQSSL